MPETLLRSLTASRIDSPRLHELALGEVLAPSLVFREGLRDASGRVRRSDLDALIVAYDELAQAYRDGSNELVKALSAPTDAADGATGSDASGVYADAVSVRTAIAELEAENRVLGTRIEARRQRAEAAYGGTRCGSFARSVAARRNGAPPKCALPEPSPRVHLASVALMPAEPVSRSPQSVAAIAGLVAFPTVVLLAWFAHAMGVGPPLGRFRLRRRR